MPLLGQLEVPLYLMGTSFSPSRPSPAAHIVPEGAGRS